MIEKYQPTHPTEIPLWAVEDGIVNLPTDFKHTRIKVEVVACGSPVNLIQDIPGESITDESQKEF